MDDGFSLSVIEGQAILIEVTQSVTVAALGYDVVDGAADILGSAPSIAILDPLSELRETQRAAAPAGPRAHQAQAAPALASRQGTAEGGSGPL